MTLINSCVLFYIAAFIGLAFAAFYLYFQHKFKYWKTRGVPTLKPEFPYGNCRRSITVQITLGELFREWYEKFKAEGQKHFGVYLFQIPCYVPIDPEIIKNIMSRDFHHFVNRAAIINEEEDPLSAHLFSLKDQRWRNLRQKLTPTFTSGKLKKMFQTLVNCSDELSNCLNESVTKAEPVDIKKCLVQYTTDVIGSCAFGIECNSFKDPNTDFIRLGSKLFNPGAMDRFKMFFSIMFPSVMKFFKIRVTNKEVDSFFRSLVKNTIEYREQNNVSRNDFMQLLIQLKNKGVLEDDETNETHEIGTTLTLNEASAQAFLFFIAGFETSSTTMTFCLYELAKNPHVQDETRKEIISVLKKYDGKMTYDALMEMHYFERVIQETLRKHSAIMELNREVGKDYSIPDTDVVLQQKTLVLIPTDALHHDPEYYPEPEKFDPDRFTEENKHTRPDFTYLPFGDGPRVCIGVRFGMMQTKVGLCRLLANYKFSPNPKTREPLKLNPNSFVRAALDDIWLNAERVAD